MGIEEYRDPRRLQRPNQVAHIPPSKRIEGRRRLVQDHQRPTREQGLRQTDALQHALGERGQPRVRVRAQPNERQQVAHARVSGGRRNARQTGVEAQQLSGPGPGVKLERLG